MGPGGPQGRGGAKFYMTPVMRAHAQYWSVADAGRRGTASPPRCITYVMEEEAGEGATTSRDTTASRSYHGQRS